MRDFFVTFLIETSNSPSSKMKLSVIKLIVFLFCAMGSMYQMIITSQLYLSYETITTVNYETRPIIDLPALTFCAEKTNFLKQDHFHQLFGYEFNKSLSETERNKIFDYLSQKSIKSQFQALYSLEVLLSKLNCTAFGPNATYRDCGSISPIRLSIDGRFYCFTLFSKSEEQTEQDFKVDVGTKYEYTFLFLVNLEIPLWIERLLVVIHTNDKMVSELFNIHKTTLGLHDKIKTLNYRMTTIKRLPFPYATDCKDYLATEHTSSEDCIVKCEIDSSILYSEPISQYYSMTDQSLDLNFTNKIKESEHCLQICDRKKECDQVYYELEQYEWKKSIKDKHLVNLKMPLDPVRSYVQTPRINLDEFLCYMASISNLWFGFSMIMLSTVIQQFINQVMKININFQKNLFLKHKSKKHFTDVPVQGFSLIPGVNNRVIPPNRSQNTRWAHRENNCRWWARTHELH